MTVLPEILDGTRRGTRLLASHYPYAGDTTGIERHSSHRPVDAGIPLLHGHTHDRAFGPHGSHEFHVGVDAFDFAPIHLELIDAWRGSPPRGGGYRGAGEERTAAGRARPDDVARSLGIDLDG